jgi:hypothetical protein
MTYNIYQGTELEHLFAATIPLQLAIGVAADYCNGAVNDIYGVLESDCRRSACETAGTYRP